MAGTKHREASDVLAELVDVPTFSATVAKNAFGRVLDTALSKGIVQITKRDRPRAVVMSMDAYESMAAGRRTRLDDLGTAFDALLARLRTPKARRAMRAAYGAAPATLGRAAVAVARRKRG